MIVTIVSFILVLSVLVLIHELGHFLVAKRLGIKVEEFGFGFPPRIFGIKKGETLYSINLLPVGGFVKLFGEDAAGGGSIKNQESRSKNQKVDIRRAFYARPVWQRFLVVVAGVVMNFILAVVLISYLFGGPGVAIPTEHIRITEVLPNSPAKEAGLTKGDQILSIDGKSLRDTSIFIKETQAHLGQPIQLKILQNGNIQKISLTPRKEYPKNQGPIGIGISNVEIKKYPWYQAPFFGTLEALNFSLIIVRGLGDMVFNLVVNKTTPQGVAGPVGVAQLTGQAVSYGLHATLWFIALLSINLAVLNILPIPALDGGRLFFIVIEAITQKKVNAKYESYAHAAGLIILLSLMVVITIVDVLRALSGKSILNP